MSKCLVLSVFTSDFDRFTVPAVFHWANFVSVKFLSNYRILFKETHETFFCLLIVWRIGERIGHSWERKQKSILGPGRFIIIIYHKNLTKLFEWPGIVGQVEGRATWPPPLWQIHKEFEVVGSQLRPVQCWEPVLRQGYFFSSVPVLHTRICQQDGEIWYVLKHDVTKPNVNKYVFHCQALGGKWWMENKNLVADWGAGRP